jgi:FdhD protein
MSVPRGPRLPSKDGSGPLARAVAIARVRVDRCELDQDLVAREQPLEIRIDGQTLAVVMRTPGDDLDLVRGLLLTEGVVAAPADVAALAHCRSTPSGAPEEARDNVVLAKLRSGLSFRPSRFRRNLVTSSSCGVCGRTSIDALAKRAPRLERDDGLEVEARVLFELPELLRAAQEGFSATGGLHAAALFDVRSGKPRLLVLREDVGRHNAVDKVIGAAMRHRLLPLSRCILQVSGRASFEIVQKARVAGIPLVAAVSAPSSLAVELAEAGGQTLVAFLRGDRLNVYSGTQRVRGCATAAARTEDGPTAPSTSAPRPTTGPRRRSGTRGRRRGA